MSTVTHNRCVKYPTQTGVPASHSSTHSIHNRHSGSMDILSLIRSFARKPFRTSSMSNAIAGGETSNVIGGTDTPRKSPVNLLRYRPLTDHASHTQSPHVCIDRTMCVQTICQSLSDLTQIEIIHLNHAFNVNRNGEEEEEMIECKWNS